MKHTATAVHFIMSKDTKKVVEQGARKVRRNTSIRHVLLRTIAGAGLLSVALLAPNAMQVLRMFDGGKRRKMDPKYLFGTTFEKLLLRGMVVIVHKDGGKYVKLTAEGKHELARMVGRSPDERKHKRWDKRWRIVIYDIKEERRLLRMRLQGILSTFGFYKLQNSVWIYPYDSEALVTLLKADFRIGGEVLYMVVEQVENDRKIRDHFGLK